MGPYNVFLNSYRTFNAFALKVGFVSRMCNTVVRLSLPKYALPTKLNII